MKGIIESEQLDLEVAEDEEPPKELRPGDVAITGEVTLCDYGSQFVRYWLTFIAMLGPGSCKLDVTAEIETSDGKQSRVKPSTRQWFGIFGGTGSGLMKRNVNAVSWQIGVAAGRLLTGRRWLNSHVYTWAVLALVLGLLSFIPYVGVVLGPIGIVLGFMALSAINKRELPRRKVMAIAGSALGFVGLLVSAGVTVAIIMNQ